MSTDSQDEYSGSQMDITTVAQLAIGACALASIAAFVAWAVRRHRKLRRRDPNVPVPYGVVRPMSPAYGGGVLQLKSVVVTGFDAPTPMGSMRSDSSRTSTGGSARASTAALG